MQHQDQTLSSDFVIIRNFELLPTMEAMDVFTSKSKYLLIYESNQVIRNTDYWYNAFPSRNKGRLLTNTLTDRIYYRM